MILLVPCLMGIGLGIFTGLVPGIHVNTVTIFLLSAMLPFEPMFLAVAVISMAITHTFFDFIPSILLGAPDPETALAVLPGHRMLLKGLGVEAIYLTIVGGLLAVAFSVLTLPLIVLLIPFIYGNIHNYIHVALILILASMVWSERKKMWGLYIFALSGALGLLTLNTALIPGRMALLPVFTGLFGISTMAISLLNNKTIPRQKMTFGHVSFSDAFKATVKGVVSGVVVGTLPAVGSSQAALLSYQFTKRADARSFLISVGAINTVVAMFSLVSLYTISKARSGAAVAVQAVLPNFRMAELLILVASILVAAGLSSIFLLRFTKNIVKFIQRLEYRKMTYLVIAFLVVFNFVMAGWLGLLVLFTSTCIGLLAPLVGVKRTFGMGVLMVPTILFYSGLV